MYRLKDYHDERIAVIIADEEEFQWFAAMCAGLGYEYIRSPRHYPISLSGWGTWDELGYFTDTYGIPEVTLCELQEYIDDADGRYSFSEDEFLSMIGG